MKSMEEVVSWCDLILKNHHPNVEDRNYIEAIKFYLSSDYDPWEDEKEKFKVGDEVVIDRALYRKNKAVVLGWNNISCCFDLLMSDGSVIDSISDELVKTGKHYTQIEDVINELSKGVAEY